MQSVTFREYDKIFQLLQKGLVWYKSRHPIFYLFDLWKRGSIIPEHFILKAIPLLLCLLMGALGKECLNFLNAVNRK